MQDNLGNNDGPTRMDHDQQKPIYLAAFTANNLPGETWGPRRKVNQVGPYAHLRNRSTNNNIPAQQLSSKHSSVLISGTDADTGVKNPTFNSDSATNYDENENQNERF